MKIGNLKEELTQNNNGLIDNFYENASNITNDKFKRLLTEEESREMVFVTGIAIEIEKKDIAFYFKKMKHILIPSYLKRVKKLGQTWHFLVTTDCSLKSLNENLQKIKNVSINSESIGDISAKIKTVSIPAFAPRTMSQFIKANEVWPSYYLKTNHPPVDTKIAAIVIEKVKDLFLEGLFKDVKCSMVCMIFDRDEKLVTTYDHEKVIGHAVFDAVRYVSKLKRQYLCTGFTAYLYTEPCVSCAIALVHGRIKTVFCYKKKILEGSFSNLRINYNKSLNHRYDVYFCNKYQ